ncbi:solute carrier family 22 member [Holotrichia oblita]|uniref:Solute carrier family 22 member n=2 Tax=Holotrichia oblita TaxID=644536 RepID=A0ACB9ST90_HOLOL|nr:solute carrier family 22 member [Holotrichia oblita]
MEFKKYFLDKAEIVPLNGYVKDISECNRSTEEDEDNDAISMSIGKYGRWQLKLTFLLSLFNIPCTWHIFSPTFHAAEREAWCARPPNFSHVNPELWRNLTQPSGDLCMTIDTSQLTSWPPSNTSDWPLIKCDKWEFAGEGETIISEFTLLCDRKYLNNVSEMMFLAGVAIGGFVCGLISDKFGRKRTLMGSVLIQTLLGVTIAIVPWFEMYFILRAILGFISVSVVFSGFVLSIELVGGLWRTVAGIAYLFPLSISYATIAGMAYLLRNWRHLQLAISLPGILFLGLWWILPESPRWLLAMGKTQQLREVLHHAAEVNRKPLPENFEKLILPSSTATEESAGVLDLFRTPKMRKITLLLSVIWFAVYLIYYGLVLNVGNIGGDLYINSVLSGLVEVPAIAISILFLLKMGRRWPLALTLIFSGLSCLLIIPIKWVTSDLQWLVTTLAMTGKFLVSSSNAVVPVFTAELYPTTMRNLGVGASNISAGIALMLVPYLFETVSIYIPVVYFNLFTKS